MRKSDANYIKDSESVPRPIMEEPMSIFNVIILSSSTLIVCDDDTIFNKLVSK
jgi:hypothetical protein